MGVLSGYRVLDCTIAMAGPFAAQRLGDLGADVVKIEPVAGEWQRHVAAGGARGNKINVSFLSLNRNKRSLAVDLKRPEGKAALLDLVRTADVFLQNYRPGVAARLGVDYESLVRGQSQARLCVDVRIWRERALRRPAWAGSHPPGPVGRHAVGRPRRRSPRSPRGNTRSMRSPPRPPSRAVLAALLHRERTGEGQLVSVNMLDAITTLQMQELSVFTVSGKPQERSAEPHAHVYIRAPMALSPPRTDYIIVAFPKLKTFGALIGEPSFATMDDETDTWTQRDLIFARTRERLKTKTTDGEWLDLFRRNDIWAGPVYGYADLVADPQIAHNGTFVEYDHPTEGRVKTPGFPYKFSETPSQG